MPTKDTFSVVLTDGVSILDARCNCSTEELARLNRTVRDTLGEGFSWEPVR